MWQSQADVAEFMTRVKGLTLPSRLRVPTKEVESLCVQLMVEELDELEEAMHQTNIVLVADGIADLLYVTLYTANAYGLDIEPIWQEVQRSNMTKGGAKSISGKQLKGPYYEPPILEPILEKMI